MKKACVPLQINDITKNCILLNIYADSVCQIAQIKIFIWKHTNSKIVFNSTDSWHLFDHFQFKKDNGSAPMSLFHFWFSLFVVRFWFYSNGDSMQKSTLIGHIWVNDFIFEFFFFINWTFQCYLTMCWIRIHTLAISNLF